MRQWIASDGEAARIKTAIKPIGGLESADQISLILIVAPFFYEWKKQLGRFAIETIARKDFDGGKSMNHNMGGDGVSDLIAEMKTFRTLGCI
jgi:hypothetical protein